MVVSAWFFALLFKEKYARWPLMKVSTPKPAAATAPKQALPAVTQRSLQKTKADKSVITEIR
jgi:hypothetical protein